MDQSDLTYLFNLVEKKSGIYLTIDKSYLFEIRLRSLIKEGGMSSIEELVAHLKKNSFGSLHEQVIDAMTTNETSFFRDRVPFDVLKDTVLPEVIRDNMTSRNIHIWCAACSAGQEPYSILMLIKEHFPELNSWNIEITATDISAEMLEKARKGIYSDFEFKRGITPTYKKYFNKLDTGWQIQEHFFKHVSFSPLNLIAPWPSLPRMDIIFLRNVLIYFRHQVKEEILHKMQHVLKPRGYLFLGQSETTSMMNTGFDTKNVESTSVYQLKSRSTVSF